MIRVSTVLGHIYLFFAAKHEEAKGSYCVKSKYSSDWTVVRMIGLRLRGFEWIPVYNIEKQRMKRKQSMNYSCNLKDDPSVTVVEKWPGTSCRFIFLISSSPISWSPGRLPISINYLCAINTLNLVSSLPKNRLSFDDYSRQRPIDIQNDYRWNRYWTNAALVHPNAVALHFVTHLVCTTVVISVRIRILETVCKKMQRTIWSFFSAIITVDWGWVSEFFFKFSYILMNFMYIFY